MMVSAVAIPDRLHFSCSNKFGSGFSVERVICTCHARSHETIHSAPTVSIPCRAFHFLQGNPLYQDDVGKMCYNPAKNWQIGWYNDRKVMLSLLSRPAGWETMVTLVGIADYQNTSDVPVVLKLETGTNNDYFVGFNRAAGINADNKQSDNELTIVQTGNNGNSYSQSWLKTTLQVSEQYTIRDFGGVDGLDIVVILDSIDKPSDGWQANVRIVNASPTKPPSRKPSTRQPSRKPSSQTASPVGSPANGSEGDRPTSLSASPSESSTASPTTARPTRKPTTRKPTAVPTTRAPTQMPTNEPMTSEPTTNKSTTRAQPTVEPTTASPTTSPSASPTKDPTGSPTSYPTTDHVSTLLSNLHVARYYTECGITKCIALILPNACSLPMHLQPHRPFNHQTGLHSCPRANQLSHRVLVRQLELQRHPPLNLQASIRHPLPPFIPQLQR